MVVWAAFAVVATAAQCGLHDAPLPSPMVAITSPVVGGVLLVVAGIYQRTPLKHACLSKCRSPLGFVLNEWREGRRGAFLMGLKHGGYCAGCCWSLMALLFVAGVMNLLWVAAIAGFVLIEKAAPGASGSAGSRGWRSPDGEYGWPRGCFDRPLTYGRHPIGVLGRSAGGRGGRANTRPIHPRSARKVPSPNFALRGF